MKNTPATLEKRNALRKHWRETIDLDSFPHQIERICLDCGELKPCMWTSSFSQGGKPEYRTRCKPCLNIRANKHGKTVRPKRTTQALDRKYLAKVKCVEYLGGACSGCGYDRCVKALTFHHREPGKKAFAISQMLDRAWSILSAELDKCELLCFNCHMEEHCGIDQGARLSLGQPKKNGCLPH
jgi:hypothetical protein